jgi:hypothetical protein
MDFQVKLIENLIAKYCVTVERPLSRPLEKVTLTRMDVSHYLSYSTAKSVRAEFVSALYYAL